MGPNEIIRSKIGVLAKQMAAENRASAQQDPSYLQEAYSHPQTGLCVDSTQNSPSRGTVGYALQETPFAVVTPALLAARLQRCLCNLWMPFKVQSNRVRAKYRLGTFGGFTVGIRARIGG